MRKHKKRIIELMLRAADPDYIEEPTGIWTRWGWEGFKPAKTKDEHIIDGTWDSLSEKEKNHAIDVGIARAKNSDKKSEVYKMFQRLKECPKKARAERIFKEIKELESKKRS